MKFKENLTIKDILNPVRIVATAEQIIEGKKAIKSVEDFIAEQNRELELYMQEALKQY